MSFEAIMREAHQSRTPADFRNLRTARKLAHEAKCERDLAAFRKKVAEGKAKPKVRVK